MLVRATRRQSSHRLSHYVAYSYDQLQLPWLCPSVSRCLEQHRPIATSPSPPNRPLPRRPRASHDLVSHQRRSATAAADPSHSVSHYDNYIPFAKTSDTSQIPSLSEPWQYGSDPIRNPIRPQHASSSADVRFRSTAQHGISGDLNEKLQHFYACIRANRLDRAALLIRDLRNNLMPDQPELINAHEQYLISLLELQMADATKERFIAMQKWLELDIRGRKTPLTGIMVSTLIKAALTSLEGAQQTRTIRRYLAQATEAGPQVEEDTFSSPMLDEEDITQIVPLSNQHYGAYDTISIQTQSDPPISQAVEEFRDNTPLSEAEAEAISDTSHDGASLPELRPADQKGLGVSAVKNSLLSASMAESQFQDPAQAKANAILVQESIEQDVVAAALERWRSENEQTKQHRTRGTLVGSRLGAHIYEWVEKMKGLIQADLDKISKIDSASLTLDQRDLAWVAPHLACLKPEQIAGAAVIAYLNSLVTASTKHRKGIEPMVIPLNNQCQSIANAIEDEIKVKIAMGKWKSLLRNTPMSERRQKIQMLMRNNANATSLADAGDDAASKLPLDSEHAIDSISLPRVSAIKMGAIVLQWLVKAATLPYTHVNSVTGHRETETVPVLTIETLWTAGKRLGVLRTHEAMTERMKREPNEQYISKYLPMVVEPRPWQGLKSGAYLKTETSALRLSDESGAQADYIKIADKRGDLKGIYKALDIIGKVPWKVNGPLFQVITEAWNSGEALAGLAPEDAVENIPPEPPREDQAAHRRWVNIARQARNEAMGLHSQRCFQNVQFEVARAYLGKTFYCPHSIDFRGRAYPIPPYFNHMGPDYIRALFVFANGKKLGDQGLRWLKIHLANVYGYDKESLLDREQFVMQHIEDIYDSAKNPLKGKRWWLKAGDPWQCLAACIELTSALESPLPSRFVSRLPIQQDGSCNGLQHYAALGGDKFGAQQVNLVPGDKPADIYSAVADLVRGYVNEDASKGVKEAQAMVGHVARKVVKQPVMTNVYGVTFVGASAQVRKQLVDILPKESLDNDIDIAGVSCYVARLIFKALGEMFNGAQAIQHWLGESATKISSIVTREQIKHLQQSSTPTVTPKGPTVEPGERRPRIKPLSKDASDLQFRSSVVWTTPLGLPVVQPYREHKIRFIPTQIKQISISTPKASDPVHKRRQYQGFPPNFIHSLDATHMMLSAIKCDESGLQFAAVHDSFWTHAGDVPVMNRILRDAFVSMHSENVVERLREELMARYEGSMERAYIPETAALGKELKAWYKKNGIRAKTFGETSIQSKGQVDLVLLEVKRQDLLNSTDADKQAEGRDMVTPASIVEAHGGLEAALAAEKALRAQNELEDVDAGEPRLDNDNLTNTASLMESADALRAAAPDSPLGVAEPPEHYDIELPNMQPSENSKSPAKRKAKPISTSRRVYFWTPLRFSPAPQKGSFDVRQLRDSQYFFS